MMGSAPLNPCYTLTDTFGANVRHYRKARGMTQEQFAAATDLSLAMMGKIERGDTAPSFDSVEKIAAALDVPEGALFPTGRLWRSNYYELKLRLRRNKTF